MRLILIAIASVVLFFPLAYKLRLTEALGCQGNSERDLNYIKIFLEPNIAGYIRWNGYCAVICPLKLLVCVDEKIRTAIRSSTPEFCFRYGVLRS